MNSHEQRSTNRITRSQGYRNAMGKEAISKAIFQDFCTNYNFDIEEITDLKSQLTLGDYRNADRYIELKSQNIGAYPQNVFELGEFETGNTDRHTNGHDTTAEWLHRNGIDLHDVVIHSRAGTQETKQFGNPITYNCGCNPMLIGNADYFYVNRDTKLVFFYKNATLKALLLEQIRQDRVFWIGGRANETAIGCFIKNSSAQWQKTTKGWEFLGNPDIEKEVWDYLKG